MTTHVIIAKLIVASVCGICALVKYATVATAPRSWKLLLHILPALGWTVIGFSIMWAANLLIGAVLALAVMYAVEKFMTVREGYLEAKRRVPPTTKEWLRGLKHLPWIALALVLLYGVTFWRYQHKVVPVKPPTEKGQFDPAPSPTEKATEKALDSLGNIQPK